MTTDTNIPAVAAPAPLTLDEDNERENLIKLVKNLGNLAAVARVKGWELPEARRRVRAAFREEGLDNADTLQKFKAEQAKAAADQVELKLLEDKVERETVGEYTRRSGKPTFAEDLADIFAELRAERQNTN